MRNSRLGYGAWILLATLLGVGRGTAQSPDSLGLPFQATGAVEWTSGPPGTSTFRAYEGDYTDGRPTGPWELQFGTFRPGGDAVFENFSYRIPLDGVWTQIRGEVAEGQFDGRWMLETTRITASRPGKQLFRSAYTFEAGTATQTFEVLDTAAILVGRFQRDGLAHDLWETYTEEGATETWRFVDGRLEEISFSKGAGSMRWKIFPSDGTTYEIDQLDATYLRIIERWRMMDKASRSATPSPTARLLARNAVHYDSITTTLQGLGADGLRAHFPVEVPVFPYTDDEREALIELGARLLALDAELGRLRVDLDTIEIGRPSLEQTLNTMEEIALPPFRELFALYREGILVHLPRERYLPRHWADGSIPTVEAAIDQTMMLEARLDSVRALLNRTRALDARQRSLLLLEGEIGASEARLDSLIAAQDKRLARRFGLPQIRQLATNTINAYKGLTELEVRETAAPRVMKCLNDLAALARALMALPEQQAEIAALYTDRVWNNFTATIMEETVKKRLLSAYETELIPYFQRWARSELTCDNAAELQTLIGEVHAILRDLRYRDTKDLEARLRAADGPRPIIELLYESAEL